MKIKNLLAVVLTALTGLSASAFPSYTLNPASGATYDDAYYLSSINVVFSSNVTKQSGASATLKDEAGNIFTSTDIRDFTAMQAGTFIVKFDSDQLQYNGTYTLTIPEGTFKASGESNKEIVATYTMKSRYLTEPGEQKKTYDPITLISTDPAEGSVIMGLGNVAGWVNTISFNTSNNAAVNYIGWTLYDVTDPENPLFVYQSNENRIDTNRNGHSGDSWGSTPKISIGGEAVRLMSGHTFKMELIFAGIGYDPVSNQYPSPVDIETSKLLETSVTFQGGMAPPVYSPYEVTFVSPGDGYEIADPDFSFMMVYSGPVKPTTFSYFKGPGEAPEAGTYTAMGEVDENGYSEIWKYTFHNGILQEAEGTIMVNIKAVDAEGKTVKGSGDFDYENYLYNITFNCNLGADVVTLVEPASGVASLGEIVVGNSAGKEMSYMSGTATITQGDKIVRTLDNPVASGDAGTTMKWTFEPIADAGVYVLNIPAAYFSIGSSVNNEAILNVVVIGGAHYDVVVTDVTPTGGATVEEISSIQLGIPANTDIVKDSNGQIVAKASLYSVNASGVECLLDEGIQGEVITGYDANNLVVSKVKFSVSEAYSQEGQYRFKVEKGLFGDTEFIESNGASGRASCELTLNYFIGNPGGGDNPSEGEKSYVVNFNNPIDMTDENWVIEHGWRHIFGWFEDNDWYADKTPFEHRVEYTHYTSGGKYDSGYLKCGNQNYKDNSMWYDPVHVNDMFVTPEISGKVSVWVRAQKLSPWLITSAKIRVYEINADGTKGEMLKELTTDDFGTPADNLEWEEVVIFDTEDNNFAKARTYKNYGLSFSNMDIDDITVKADVPTSVESVVAPETVEDDVIYSITGIRVQNPDKGIYIKNGKKVIIK